MVPCSFMLPPALLPSPLIVQYRAQARTSKMSSLIVPAVFIRRVPRALAWWRRRTRGLGLLPFWCPGGKGLDRAHVADGDPQAAGGHHRGVPALHGGGVRPDVRRAAADQGVRPVLPVGRDDRRGRAADRRDRQDQLRLTGGDARGPPGRQLPAGASGARTLHAGDVGGYPLRRGGPDRKAGVTA